MPVINYQTGVYCITNTFNGKQYIGSTTVSFTYRWKNHLKELKSNRHHSKHLQAAWNRYGGRAFEFSILIRCSPDNCLMWEQKYLDRLQTFNDCHGYNMTPRAGSLEGHTVSVETRKKLRMANLGKTLSVETRTKMSSIRRGKVLSLEARLNIRKGKASLTHRKLMSDLTKAQWANPEIRLKTSLAQKAAWARRKAIAAQGARI